MLQLEPINLVNYPEEKDNLYALIDQIWVLPTDAYEAKHSIDRWGTSGTESGEYFYIISEGKRVGITGYFIPNFEEGVFGLRHHGTSIKGTGRLALDMLVLLLRDKFGENFKYLIELVPESREDLIPKFEEWGFTLSSQEVPEWEPKKHYYKYVLIREF